MKIILPLKVFKEYKTKPGKNIYINLNNYRNWNRRTEHDIKVLYENAVRYQLSSLSKTKLQTPIVIEYYLIVGDKRIKDTNNLLSIIDKYFSDAITSMWLIPDDNYLYITRTINSFGWYEKGKGRVEVKILENQNKKWS